MAVGLPSFLLSKTLIDAFIKWHLKPGKMSTLSVASEDFPEYRFADFHRAVTAFLGDKHLCGEIASRNHISLRDIITNDSKHVSRMIKTSGFRFCPVGYEKTEAFPEDYFWVFHDQKRNFHGVIRVRIDHNGLVLEVALTKPDMLTAITKEIVDLSIANSVYRNHYLQIDLESAIANDYGMPARGMQVLFRPPPKIPDDEIIFDPEVKQLIDRNVISFVKNRKQLHELGLPLQRGVLLYGPPGTGKTFTCQYLFEQLQPVTMLTVSGKGLGEVRSICTLARMLQPSVLVLEDVDLIFTSREINLYSTALGEMMDELDAFKQNDSVLFLMTTNEIDRLEAAIKDRPGRVSQCIFFGPPTHDLRKRYLARYLRPFDQSQVSLDNVAKMTEGASQAFLEELVYRAVQIAAETDAKEPTLTDDVFREAVNEMTRDRDLAVGSIIGFQPTRT